jgi:protein SCO1/2
VVEPEPGGAGGGAPADDGPNVLRAGTPGRAPAGVRLLRFALWSLLLMVLFGLFAVWWWGTGRRAADAARLPDLGEVPGFALVDHRGARVTREQLAGSPWVADFVFTRCTSVCPLMTEKMAALGPALPPSVRRVSVSVDPTHDTPEVLARYAQEHAGGDPGWLFLTGGEEEVHRLVVGGFKLGLAKTPADDPRAAAEPITHSTRIVLVDAAARIRGYYDAFDPAELETLARDAGALAAAAQAGSREVGSGRN